MALTCNIEDLPLEEWSVGVLEYWVVKAEKAIFNLSFSSPSLCELVLNKVKEDKFTHHSSIPLFQLGGNP